MKRYVDVKKCYKKYSYFIKKKTTKSEVFVILSPLFILCVGVICWSTFSCLFEGSWILRDLEADHLNQLNTFSNQRHVSPILSTFLISKSMAEVSGVRGGALDLVAW